MQATGAAALFATNTLNGASYHPAQNKLPGPAPASVADAQHHGLDHGAVTSTEMAEALAALEDSSLTVLMPLTVAAWGWRT